jgi:hypothetical protein
MRAFLLVLCISWATILSLFSQTESDTLLVADTIVTDSVTADTITVELLTDVMTNATVHQDSLIRQLMLDKYLGIERGTQEREGFRVQVYSSNSQQVAKNEALKLQQELASKLDYPVYTISEPPFWKVRIGNFLTREEAIEYKNALVKQYVELQGSTYVVPDKVIVTQ